MCFIDDAVPLFLALHHDGGGIFVFLSFLFFFWGGGVSELIICVKYRTVKRLSILGNSCKTLSQLQNVTSDCPVVIS